MGRLTVLAAIVCLASHTDVAALPSVNADGIKAWHRELDADALILPEFSIEAKGSIEALRLAMRAYGVSINIYLNPSTQREEAFHYRGSNVSLATVLEAICGHFGLKWERDEDTGVSWLLPEAAALKDVLSYEVTIDEARPGWPLYSGLLTSLERGFTKATLRGEERTPAVVLAARGFVGAREGSFDIPTNLEAGNYQALGILHHYNQLAPWLTFYVWDDANERFPTIEMHPRLVAGGHCDEPAPGWRALWEMATDGAAPDFAETLQAMLRTREHGGLGAHLARFLCRGDRHYVKALSAAKTPEETASVVNSFGHLSLNTRGARLPPALEGAALALLDSDFYEEGPAGLVLPLLMNLAVARQTDAAAADFLTAYAKRRSFTADKLQGAEVQVAQKAYISKSVWHSLMDPEAASYIDTGNWAKGFLPKEFRRLAYQEVLPGN